MLIHASCVSRYEYRAVNTGRHFGSVRYDGTKKAACITVLRFIGDSDRPAVSALTITDGGKITTPTGETTAVIEITGSPLEENATLTIDVTYLSFLLQSGSVNASNFQISSDAVSALWTAELSEFGEILTLTSNNGPTGIGETVTVTFTGAAGNPWILNTYGEKTISLMVERPDTSALATLNLTLEISPPPEYVIGANFSASPRADMAPLNVQFRDLSAGNPTSWRWNFGDGAFSTEQHPIHTYTAVGSYSVTLNASNDYGFGSRTQFHYIHVLNGGTSTARTRVEGLMVAPCGGSPQQVTVNTTLLSAELLSDDTLLEVRPSVGQGFARILLYGTHFSRNGNLITGDITHVQLVSEEIAPPDGFLGLVGTRASFNYSMDLPAYPCDAILTTTIWEGAMPTYDVLLRQIVHKYNAGVVGTAYTAKITKANLTTAAPVTLHMKVNSSWNTSLPGGPGITLIWRIPDDNSSVQILHTDAPYTDPVTSLTQFRAISPQGLSTFGISVFTGVNNPFQMISFALQEAAASLSESGGDSEGVLTPMTVPTSAPIPDEVTPVTPDPGVTAKISTNRQGVLEQSLTLWSTDGKVKLVLKEKTVALNGTGEPLESLTLRRTVKEEIPPLSSIGAWSFTGLGYDILPDGATFSPALSLVVIVSSGQGDIEYGVKTYDRNTGNWTDLPTRYDPSTGWVIAEITHLCYVGLFSQPVMREIPQTVIPTTLVVPSALSADYGMFTWVVTFISENPLLLVILVPLVTMAVYFGWWKRR
jgi:FOG: PKD repeat